MRMASFEQVKRVLGIQDSDTSKDELIGLYLDAVGDAFDSYRGSKFGEDEITEFHDGGVRQLFLKRTPVIEVLAIYIDPYYEWDTDTKLAPDDYILRDANTGIVLYKDGLFSLGIDEKGIVKVIYNAGYHVGNLPADLTRAAIDQTVYSIRRQKDLGLSRVYYPDGQIQKVEIDEFLESVKQVLDRYCPYYI